MKIGVITIGQSPRPDLTRPVQAALPGHHVIEAGALDGEIGPWQTQSDGLRYPLMTTVSSGQRIVIDETELAPLLQRAARSLEAQGVAVSLLACAGPFAELRGDVPIVRPFTHAAATLRALGMRRIGVFSPSLAQRAGCEQKWTVAGFAAAIWTPPGASHQPDPDWLAHQAAREAGLDGVVLDYVGYPTGYAAEVQRRLSLPLIDLGGLALSALTALVK